MWHERGKGVSLRVYLRNSKIYREYVASSSTSMQKPFYSSRNRGILPRLTGIHRIIDAGNHPSKLRLSEYFGVSVKTIERDIWQLKHEFGAPVEYDSIKRGYHYAKPFPGVVFTELTEREEIALLLAQVVLNSSQLKPLGKTINHLAENASKYADKFSLYHQINERISCSQTESPSISEAQILKLVRAIFDEHTISFDYRKPGSVDIERRIVHPYHLTNAEGEWYLKGHCEARNQLRTFKIQRISNLKTLSTPFVSDPGYNILELVHGSMGGFSGNQIFEIKVELDAYATEYLKEKELHETQDLEISEDGKAVMILYLNNLMDIQRWVLSWGEHVKAISPKELVASVKETLHKTLNQYSA